MALQLLVKRMKNSKKLISQEQNFIHKGFILVANNQMIMPSKMHIW
jgi:hypothetical protein